MVRILAIIAALAAFLTAAGQYANIHGSGQRLITVGVIHLKNVQGVPWYEKNIASLKNSLQGSGINTIFYPAKDQVDQIRAVRYCIRQKADAIVIVPAEQTGWDTVLNDCRRAGIPVFAMDREIKTVDSALITMKIATDKRSEGRQAFEIMNATLKDAPRPPKDGKHYNIAMIEGSSSISTSEERRAGFLDALLESQDMPLYNVIATIRGNFHRAGGHAAATELLQKYAAKIDIIFAQSDEMALGAVAAIKEAGLKPGEDIMIFSVDGLDEAKTAMAAGEINGTVECTPYYGPAMRAELENVLYQQSTILNKGINKRIFTINP